MNKEVTQHGKFTKKVIRESRYFLIRIHVIHRWSLDLWGPTKCVPCDIISKVVFIHRVIWWSLVLVCFYIQGWSFELF